MKRSPVEHALRAVLFGLVMTAVSALWGGGLRFSGAGWAAGLPIWLQLVRLFVIYAVVFWAVCMLADWLEGKGKKKKR